MRKLGIDPSPTPADVDAALQAARTLISWGVPVFWARPALDAQGNWLPAGGHRGTGYWLPRGWNRRRPNPTVLRSWRPGMALCAVMGNGLDLLDVDPRNGGEASMEALVRAGVWPTAVARAATPSGGMHYFVASLGIRSRDGVLPGLDVKAGTEGTGRGFAFLAPTRRLSKTAGRVEPYRWELEPTGPTADRGRRPRRAPPGTPRPGTAQQEHDGHLGPKDPRRRR